MYVMPGNNMKLTIKESGNPEALLDGLLECVSALHLVDRERLEEIVKTLKQQGGEEWAVGEMLQRIIYFLRNTGAFVSDTTIEKNEKTTVKVVVITDNGEYSLKSEFALKEINHLKPKTVRNMAANWLHDLDAEDNADGFHYASHKSDGTDGRAYAEGSKEDPK